MANTEIERYPILATKEPGIPDFGHWSILYVESFLLQLPVVVVYFVPPYSCTRVLIVPVITVFAIYTKLCWVGKHIPGTRYELSLIHI